MEDEPLDRLRDRMVDSAKEQLLVEYFAPGSQEVFYQRQLEVLLEGTYFHWIVGKALNELAAERRIGATTLELGPGTSISVYWTQGNRYWKRRANAIRATVSKFSEITFTRALGRQGEMLFDAALPRLGMVWAASNVNSYGGRTYTESGHDPRSAFSS